MNINGVAQEVVEAGYGKICLRDEKILLLLLFIHKVLLEIRNVKERSFRFLRKYWQFFSVDIFTEEKKRKVLISCRQLQIDPPIFSVI